MIEDLSYAEDLLFNLEYLDAVTSKEICMINTANYIYCDIDTGSLSHKFRLDLKEINKCVFDAMEHYMKKWGLIDSQSVAKYYSTVYYKSVEIMKNTFHKENAMTYFEKIEFNNRILRSERFVKALSFMDVTIPFHLKIVYQTKNYFWVRVYDRMIQVYGRIKRYIIILIFVNILQGEY